MKKELLLYILWAFVLWVLQTTFAQEITQEKTKEIHQSTGAETIFSEILNGTSTDINAIQAKIEKTLNMKSFTIDSAIPYNSIKEVLETKCSTNSINNAKDAIKWLNEKWYDSLPTTYTEKVKTLKSRFSFVQEVVGWVNPNAEKETFCKQKYLLYSIWETTQNYYNTLSWKTKMLSFIHATDELTGSSVNTIRRIDVFLQRVIEELKLKGILEEEDLNRLDEKIQINYKPVCEAVNGSFHVVKNKETWYVTFKSIEINIPMCNWNFPPAMEEQIKRILSHEIGHYVYFFKDSNPENFTEICRKNWENSCGDSDFVTEYAEAKQEEDYAESFTDWFVSAENTKTKTESTEEEHGSAPLQTILEKKNNYFKNLFK